VVLVTHNIGEAIFLADRIVTLGGRPGVVRGVVTNTMRRPRALAAMRSPEFQDLVEQVRTLLGLE
jgi:NitT/TauT family transport system ATP-binding protein